MSPHSSIPAAIFGIVIIGVVLLDAFETVVLPRRVTRHFKLTAWFYRRTWIPWRKIAGHMRPARQQSFLGYFGPLSLIMLLALDASEARDPSLRLKGGYAQDDTPVQKTELRHYCLF